MALGSSVLGVAQMVEQIGQVSTGMLPINSGPFPPVSDGGLQMRQLKPRSHAR